MFSRTAILPLPLCQILSQLVFTLMAFKTLPHYKGELATMFVVHIPLKNESFQRVESFV